MKFLFDAHLPRRLAVWMTGAGSDSVHTLDLPLRNRTTDSTLNQISLDERRVVVTKDADFVDTFVVQGRPWKLLLISTGNISNTELEALFRANTERIVGEFETGASFIELSRTSLIVHT